MTSFIIAALVLALAGSGYGLRKAICEIHFLQEDKTQISGELAACEAQLVVLTKQLETGVGGIHKRIAEMQEISNAIKQKSPELFDQEPGLPYWISASEQFLRELREIAGIEVPVQFQEKPL